MARLSKPPIQKLGARYRINLDIEERDLIHRLLGELRSLLTEPESADAQAAAHDARMKRLFPTAYHQPADADKDDEFRRLMRDELVASRLAGLDLIADALAPTQTRSPSIDEAQMMAFLQALNGIRLVLGTMLDVTEDHDIGDVGDDDPLVGEYHLYDFLSWVLDSSVRAVQS
jgi:hypothetical protein